MSKSKIIRWVTLTSSCLLLTAFILYRTGRLDKYLFNTQAKTLRAPDAPADTDSALMQPVSTEGFYMDTTELMHSSKSAPIAYPRKPQFHVADSSDLALEDSVTRELILFSGSKSGPVFTSEKQRDSFYGRMEALRKLRDSIYKKNKSQ
jgi:hypothetical protein